VLLALWFLEMAGLSTPALDVVPVARPSTFLQIIPDLLALTKPEVNFLIVIATFTGFYLGYPGDLNNFPLMRLLNTLCGTLLVDCRQDIFSVGRFGGGHRCISI